MGCTVWGSNPSGAEILRTCPDQPWGPTTLLYNGSFLAVKWPGRGIDHPHPSSTEVKERVELYIYSPSRPSWPLLGWTSPFWVCTCIIFGFSILSISTLSWMCCGMVVSRTNIQKFLRKGVNGALFQSSQTSCDAHHWVPWGLSSWWISHEHGTATYLHPYLNAQRLTPCPLYTFMAWCLRAGIILQITTGK
jgi:hypothetical protein